MGDSHPGEVAPINTPHLCVLVNLNSARSDSATAGPSRVGAELVPSTESRSLRPHVAHLPTAAQPAALPGQDTAALYQRSQDTLQNIRAWRGLPSRSWLCGRRHRHSLPARNQLERATTVSSKTQGTRGPRTVYECHLQGGSALAGAPPNAPSPHHPPVTNLKSPRPCWTGRTAPWLGLPRQWG